jgi:endonuclease YncB( thermonuclease family)
MAIKKNLLLVLISVFLTVRIGLAQSPTPTVKAKPAPKVKVFPSVNGTLHRVIDGDTAVLLIDGVLTHVRLCGIDASESKTSLGPPATALLTSLLQGKFLTVMVAGKDQYQRTVGSIFASVTADLTDKISVQAAMAKTGLAYYYSVSRCPDTQEVIDADNFAKANGLGMRGVPGYPAPWETRVKKPKSVFPVVPLPMLLSGV